MFVRYLLQSEVVMQQSSSSRRHRHHLSSELCPKARSKDVCQEAGPNIRRGKIFYSDKGTRDMEASQKVLSMRSHCKTNKQSRAIHLDIFTRWVPWGPHVIHMSSHSFFHVDVQLMTLHYRLPSNLEGLNSRCEKNMPRTPDQLPALDTP